MDDDVKALLRRAEPEWRELLRGASLVCEIVNDGRVNQKDITLGLKALKQVWRINQERQDLVRYPAVVAVSISGFAVHGFVAGGFWPQLWEEVGIHDPSVQTEWSKAFLVSLDKLRLPIFDLPLKYLGNILMHAGIPDYCMDDYFSVIGTGVRRAGSSASNVIDWLRPRLGKSTFRNVDVPVVRFLQSGGDFAEDLVDRSVDLLGRLSRGESLDGVGLGSSYVAAAQRLVGEAAGNVLRSQMRSTTAIPEVRLNQETGDLCVALPFLANAREGFAWSLSVDGVTDHVTPPLQWLKAGRGASAVDWPITKPTRRLTVEGTEQEPAIELVVLNPDDPLICFDESGKRLPDDRPLTPSPTWLLHPAGSDPWDPSRPMRVIAIGEAPTGWAGWQLRLVDLTAGNRISWGSGPSRQIQGSVRARLDIVDVVPGATSQGSVVLARRPTVSLPGDIPQASWSTSITNLATGDLLPESADVTSPFGHSDQPLVGRFEIAIRGPLGRGFRSTVAVVEGLEVVQEPPVRTLGNHGLDPAKLLLAAAVGVTLSAESIDLTGAETGAAITASGAIAELAVELRARSMAVCALREDKPAEWSHRPVLLQTEDLANTELLLRLPSLAKSLVGLAITDGRQTHQRVPPGGHRDTDTARFQLARIADTASNLGAGEVVIELSDRMLCVARFRPRRLASGVSVVGSHLTIEGAAVKSLEAVVWPALAPWEGGVLRQLEGASAELPDALLSAGPLVVQLRLVDPWMPEPPPQAPSGEHLYVIARRARAQSGSLTALLDDTNLQPADLTGQPTNRLLAVLAFTERLKSTNVEVLGGGQLASVRTAVGADPEAWLLLPQLVPDPGDQAVMAIATGLVAAGPHAGGRGDEKLSALTRTSPLVGSLAAARQSMGRDSAAMFPETSIALEDELGMTYSRVCAGRGDPSPLAARFGSTEETLASLPPALLADVVRAAGLVPRRLLDADSRAQAALQLFGHRNAAPLGRCTRGGDVAVRTIIDALRAEHLPSAAAAVEARLHERRLGGWLTLSAQSLGFALLARSAARGLEVPRSLFHLHRESWLRLARFGPMLAHIDLVLAELLLIADMDALATPSSPSQPNESGDE